MRHVGALFWQTSLPRALLEGWLACVLLLAPLAPVFLGSTPLARSLYLVLVPLLCAVLAGLRGRFSKARPLVTTLKEFALALALAAGILGMVYGLLALLGQMGSIRSSYAGTWGTLAFILMAAPEYLGMRIASWGWVRWDRLRRRRYAWALTHAILKMIAEFGLLALAGLLIWIAVILKNDIWGIPPDSVFAQLVFWSSLLLFFAVLLSVGGILLFLPPSLLFSWRVARKMTTRLESLAEATQALRAGELSRRVPVQGEDEIAQLQADFNAMAADLEGSVQALQTEKDKVWELMEARRELVADVSHELRNPAAIIRGYADAARRGLEDRPLEELENDLQAIQYEAARMENILNDLLSAAELESGHLSISTQAVDVPALAQRLVDTFSGLAWRSKRVQVTLAVPSESALAWADPLRLEQVLVNLLQNAVRHTSAGGLVAVEIHSGPGQVCIEVEDTGEGILAEDLPHIWEKYFRAGQAIGGSHGAGLGLSLVKELSEAMGGGVSVESWPGQGSLFRVLLPVCEAEDEVH